MAIVNRLLVDLPLWVVGLLIFAIVIGGRMLGALLFRRWAERRVSEVKSETEVYVVSAVFALLAFMVGITYSIAVDNYDTRRSLVVAEANAIKTVYLRAKLFDEPQRTRLKILLQRYAQLRLVPDDVPRAAIEARSRQSEALQGQLWDATVAAVYPVRETELASYFIEAMNEALNVGESRKIAGFRLIPAPLIDLLLIYTIIAAVITGYLLAREENRMRPASTLLFALFTLAIVQIIDLDRPRSGAILVSQQSIESLIAMINEDMARDRRNRDVSPPGRTAPGN